MSVQVGRHFPQGGVPTGNQSLFSHQSPSNTLPDSNETTLKLPSD